MNPVYLLRRRLIWAGPRSRALSGLDQVFISRQPLPKIPLWKGLQDQLIRQSYIITLIYDIDRGDFSIPEIVGPDASPAEEAPILNCDDQPGTLRWNDLPDPAGARQVNSRLAVTIEGEKNLCSLLQSMEHRFSREIIEECHRFILGDVVFCLSRYLYVPPDGQQKDSGTPPKIRDRLPAFEMLVPFDGENKWILTAKVEVQNGNDPEQMQKGIDELMTIKTEFEGCFDFQPVDRHTFDTRVK